MFEVGHPFGMINYATAVYGNGLIKLHQTILTNCILYVAFKDIF